MNVRRGRLYLVKTGVILTSIVAFFIESATITFKIVKVDDNFSTEQTSAFLRYKRSEPLIFDGLKDTVIHDLEIRNAKTTCILLKNCQNIIIEHCRLMSSKGNGIEIVGCKHVLVQHCWMDSINTGVYAIDSQAVQIIDNRVKNVQGPYPRGQMVQFDHVTGAGNRVVYNRCENILGKSNPIDAINMYKTSGTINDPVEIIGNLIRGGGPNKTGGGIMLGDNGGAYMLVKNNILVNPGQYGIGISSGRAIEVAHNKVYSKQQRFTNVGIYVWNQSESACSLNIVGFNEVNWTNSKGEPNDYWNNGNCGTVAGWSTNVTHAKIDEKIIDENFLSFDSF